MPLSLGMFRFLRTEAETMVFFSRNLQKSTVNENFGTITTLVEIKIRRL